MYRTIVDHSKCFTDGIRDFHVTPPINRIAIHNSDELETALRHEMNQAIQGGKTALALSGGIDSAILAKMMPRGSIAYTFKCIVPGMEVVDESLQAAKYAEECGLEHRIVEVLWEDMQKMAPIIMRHKGKPCHSIEIQIYKACLQAIADGHNRIIFGESADIVYGGMSGLLSKDRTVGDIIDRYSYVLPYKVLKNPQLITFPYTKWEKDGFVDVHKFLNDTMYEEAINSYEDACATAGIKLFMPYSKTFLDTELDYSRIRNGENKYLIREIFNRLYPGWETPQKTPMPRPLNEWMRNWKGPMRSEFWSHCTDEMTGDQKWYVYALEQFLNMIDNGEYNK
jgi:asparagine synthetase B (glutamine-hydrolysing)